MPVSLKAGEALPVTTLQLVGGGEMVLGGNAGWRLLVVYRGRHCPLCKKYLTQLEELNSKYGDAGATIVAISGDPLEKAESDRAELSLSFPVAYDLSVEQMHNWGLYVSSPRSEQETDRPFAEPGLFLLRPDGNIQIVDVSNAPFARPDLETILLGLTMAIEKDYPVRGTA